MFRSYYPNRTVCAMLDDLRECHKTRNFSYMLGIIEEIQYSVNRMEASLWDQKDVTKLREEISKLKKEKKYLLETTKALKGDKNE